MVIVKADAASELGAMPSEELLTAMSAYNDELADAGVLRAAEGLRASSHSARVRFSGEERTVVEGPFTPIEEVIAGFWIFNVASKAEAIEWVKRCPNPTREDAEIEIRPIFEPEDFEVS